jgi:hypothetical protein
LLLGPFFPLLLVPAALLGQWDVDDLRQWERFFALSMAHGRCRMVETELPAAP